MNEIFTYVFGLRMSLRSKNNFAGAIEYVLLVWSRISLERELSLRGSAESSAPCFYLIKTSRHPSSGAQSRFYPSLQVGMLQEPCCGGERSAFIHAAIP